MLLVVGCFVASLVLCMLGFLCCFVFGLMVGWFCDFWGFCSLDVLVDDDCCVRLGFTVCGG